MNIKSMSEGFWPVLKRVGLIKVDQTNLEAAITNSIEESCESAIFQSMKRIVGVENDVRRNLVENEALRSELNDEIEN